MCVLIVKIVLVFVGLCISPALLDGQCNTSVDCPRTLACVNEKCTDPCPGTCGTNANCEVVNYLPFCSCPPGHTGDPFIECVRIQEVGDNKTEIVAISLTGSETPFAYIEEECVNSPFSCRKFTCAVFSNVTPSIFWRFRSCQGNICVSDNRTGTTARNGLQVSSTIELEKREYGYLYCVIKNTEDELEVQQEVVSYNNTGQVFIEMKEFRFYPKFYPDEDFVELFWIVHIGGYPEPNVTLLINNKTINKLSYNISDDDPYHFSVTMKNMSYKDLTNQFSLQAVNEFESRFLNLSFEITDFFNVSVKVDSLDSTKATLKCIAISVQDPEIKWFLDREQIPPIFSNRTSLTVTSYINVNSSSIGNIMCSSNLKYNGNWTEEIKSISGSIDISGPIDIINVDEKTKWIQLNENVRDLTFTCSTSTLNHTNNIILETTKTVEGTEIGKKFLNPESCKVKVYTVSSEVWRTIFSYHRNFTVPGFEGTYFCKTPNVNHKDTYDFLTIEIRRKSAPIWPYFAIVTLFTVILLISAYVVVKIRNYQKLRKEMEELNAVGLANFEKGALENLNPSLTIDDQVDLLPYDKEYEFPIENLTLGQQIGSGAFGVVVKGEAKDMFEGKPSTTVAVKMVNKSIGDVCIRALASELKIMIYLGKHVNVVNLLGACTNNIAKKELLVIVEYCRFGNLKDYLLSHRHTFINQINAETGRINFDIGSDMFQKSSEHSKLPSVEYDNMEAEKESRYKGDYEDVNKLICTNDLLIWSFQVARGMEYLASRKVLHGDLAARNILLADDNVVKICDFGLSKKMYQKDIYKKSGDEMLPVKWMAVEAITDKIFSVHSDVWSFGVVLWEFFSLARTPYPGMELNKNFCEKLLDGFRMKAPQYANQEIYNIILRCWDGEPLKRPSFTQLAHMIGSVLDERIRKHYLDMNAGYLKMNTQRFNEKNADYTHSFNQYFTLVNAVNCSNDDDNESSTYM